MAPKKPVLLIPVENQVRELDGKLLLACIAARRGLPSIIGPKREIESRMRNLSFPRSIYLAKSMLRGHQRFLQAARKHGHAIAAWDEDALVHLPAETYFSRRLWPQSIACVSHLFAWGEDNAELWRQYPELPAGTPIHVTGNPRGDLLRPELRGFYQNKVEELQQTYGDFILINTNFNHVNAFTADRNLFLPADKSGEAPEFGHKARGMTREYAEGLRDHKQATFEHFQKMIPGLEKAFPDYTILVRPHQVENQEVYHRIAAQCERVRVTNEGNVVSWLMAARALIHNGCTTSVEAYATGLPVISYRATVNDYYDLGFYQLPNGLSHQCFDFEELQHTLKKILAGELSGADEDEKKALIDHHLAALSGPLACERIVDVLVKIADDLSKLPKPPLRDRLTMRYKATRRRWRKQSKSSDTGPHKSLAYHRHKYSGISSDDLRARIARFQQVLEDDGELNVNQIYARLFRISA
jgi:surface carbohydrate biosynthesis protein